MGHICHWDDGRVSFWTSWIILLIHIYATSWINTSKKMFRKSRMTKTMMPPNRDGRLKMGKVLSIMAISLLSFPQRFLSFCFSDLFHSSLCYLYTQSNFFNTIQQIGKRPYNIFIFLGPRERCSRSKRFIILLHKPY